MKYRRESRDNAEQARHSSELSQNISEIKWRRSSGRHRNMIKKITSESRNGIDGNFFCVLPSPPFNLQLAPHCFSVYFLCVLGFRWDVFLCAHRFSFYFRFQFNLFFVVAKQQRKNGFIGKN